MASAFFLFLRYEKPALFQGMKERIQGARTEFVAVSAQLFNHPPSKNVTLAGMVENVKADQTCVKVLICGVFITHCQDILHLNCGVVPSGGTGSGL